MGQLDGKVAIVTGGSRGLGGSASDCLAAKGAAVVIADIMDDVGEAKAASLREAGHQADFIHLDVREASQWKAVIDHVTGKYGRLDVLVNNAGISLPGTIESSTVEEFRRVLDINLIGPYLGMQAAIPVMKESGGGSIINISSNSTQLVMSLTALYSPSKAALANLTKSAAVHCARSGYNIRVNSVHPGPHATQMLLGEDGDASQGAELPAVKALINSIPMGRMGMPGDIGPVVAFLASDDSGYMTGAELFVDGGLTMAPMG